MFCLKQNDDAGFRAIMKLFGAMKRNDSTTVAQMMLTEEIKLAISWGRANIPENWDKLEALITEKGKSNESEPSPGS